ncbi:DUF2723 domain-containing protein [Alistipes sp. OttesenSCG-928-B03]|nr:DUF2723 domain-containing protein [Alistipes sp. OttesenSCG-928-B03]
MTYFKKWNLIAGWAAFAVASIVYILTMEPTASLWDCAEFIATSYKLEVGHPPGAPLFMMIARFFSMFAPSTASVGMMVNLMSSLCGGFTVMFLFWTITHLARKIYQRGGEELTRPQAWTVIGAGLVGALAYCFTDTQWFSAVEGEVYSMSSMFTAMVVWMMLQWESAADKPHSSRWLILIAYMMGLSIGVHILNLLAIPAIVFIYYFKKSPKVTWKGVLKTTLMAGALILAVYFIIVPYTVSIGAWVDKVFVNKMGLPVNSGLGFFVLLIFALCALGIWWTHKRGKALANIVMLCFTFIMIGYSSYASVIIRAAADPPMNSNDPSNPYGLLGLINRDQYGSQPLLYGPYYSSRPIDYKYATVTYLGDDGEYHEVERFNGYVYPGELKYFFPRTWSAGRQSHIDGYKSWGRITGVPTRFNGQLLPEPVPTFGENMRYFFSYQLNHMYWRYFLWNFVGRQNDIQSNGLLEGNWISGIGFIDQLYLGPQDNLPSEMKENRGRNTYYFLPFILGLIGLIYQVGRDKRNFTVVMWLFVMMGIALVVYFNTTPGEPRERDYVYAGSFYAFCIWIGFGVLALRDWLTKITKKDTVAVAAAATVIGSCVPGILVAQNWDDHDRSHRYIARDVGWNYLQSTLPNSIIMNYGDNDTFPLWYNQEVEDVRPDVRIMNMSYLLGDWYIDQMKHKYNDSDPVPFTLPRDKYLIETNNQVRVADVVDEPVSLREVMNFIKSNEKRTQVQMEGIGWVDYIPTKTVYLPVNRENAIASGIVREKDAHLMLDTIEIKFAKESIDKSEMMLLDLLDNFDWKRPIYFTQSFMLDNLGLGDYLQFDGFAYRLVPIRTPRNRNSLDTGRLDTEYVYDKLMNVFKFGNVSDPRVYTDYFVQYTLSSAQARNAFARLADGLIMEGDTLRAVEVLDAAMEKLPMSQIRHSYIQTIPIIAAYYKAGAFEKGNVVMDDYTRVLGEYVSYLLQFRGKKAMQIYDDLYRKLIDIDALFRLAIAYGQEEQADQLDRILTMYESVYGKDEPA